MLVSDCCVMISEARDRVTDETIPLMPVVERFIACAATVGPITSPATSLRIGTALSQRLMPVFFVCMVRLSFAEWGLCAFDVEGDRILVCGCCVMISEARDSVTDETVPPMPARS